MPFNKCELCNDADEDVLELDANTCVIGMTSYTYLHQECMDELEEVFDEDQDQNSIHKDETVDDFMEHENHSVL